MDETVGQWLAMIPLSVYAVRPDALTDGWFRMWTIASLILFRFFDIVKPLGVRKMEELPGGWGIMADDILGRSLQLCDTQHLHVFHPLRGCSITRVITPL